MVSVSGESGDSTKFVKPATAGSVEFIASLQKKSVESMLRRLHSEAQVDPQQIYEVWAKTIAEPPQADRGVLVAWDEGTPVGFAAFQIATLSENRVAEILALEIHESATRQGHASRLMSAVADLARSENSDHLKIWVVPEDEARIRFIQSAGFAPEGLRRELDAGDVRIHQHSWYSLLKD